jgi:hypothetical protein
MYCKKQKINMKESTCLARYKWHSKPLEERQWFQSAMVCAKCAQGKKVYQKYMKAKGSNMEQLKMKKCAKCKKEKVADLIIFSKDAKSKDGLSYWCKQCHRAHGKAVRLKAKGKKANKDKKSLKKQVVTKKQPAAMSFPGVLVSDTGDTLVLDFCEHLDLLNDLRKSAKENLRTPEMQGLWLISRCGELYD